MENTLRVLMNQNRIGLPIFVEYSIKIVENVRRVHNDFRIYPLITPDHIFIDTKTNEIRVNYSDSEDTSEIDLRYLPYISPEATGRLRRKIDHRSNIYTLGIIFYEILSGRYPFQAHEMVEWMHAHLAEAPESLDSQIPAFIQMVLFKCLAKLPEERYQSAEGLLFDLHVIKQKLEGSLKFYPLAVGTSDIPRALRISRKLYSREHEIEILREKYQRTLNGEYLTIFVSGEEGSGKSSLINEFLDKEVLDNTLLGIGRLPRNQIVVPYAPLSNACQYLLQNILASNDQILEYFKVEFSKIKWPVVFIDIIPDFRYFIETSLLEQGSLNLDLYEQVKMAFFSFFSVISNSSNSIIIFLDDLQIADNQTFLLISLLTQQTEFKSMLWILCSKNRYFNDQPVDWIKISIPNLDVHAIHMMLLDTLSVIEENLQPLIQLIMDKTSGNPLNVRVFLIELIENRFLYFDSDQNRWVILLDQIQDFTLSSSIDQEYSLSWMENINYNIINILFWLSCLGSCKIEFLKALFKNEKNGFSNLLAEASERGYILVKDSGMIRFISESLREAIYKKMDLEERKFRHDQIALLLLDEVGHENDKDLLYEIVHHLQRGKKDSDHRIQYAQWHLQAGIHAKESAAYQLASTLLFEGNQSLRYSDWNDEHNLRWNLSWQLCFCEYAQNHVQRAEYYLDQALRMAISDEQIFFAVKMKILLSTHRGYLNIALESGFVGLSRLGLRMPKVKEKDFLLQRLLTRFSSLSYLKPTQYLKLKTLQDLVISRQLELLYAISTAVFRYQPKRIILISDKILFLSKRYGVRAETAIGLMGYSLYLFEKNRLSNKWRKYAIVGLRLARRFKSPNILTIIYFSYAVFLEPWFNPYEKSLHHLEESSILVKKTGDVTVGSYIGDFLLLFRWLHGDYYESEEKFFDMNYKFSMHSSFTVDTSFKEFLRSNFQHLKFGVKGSLMDYPWEDAEISIRYFMMIVTCLTALVWQDPSIEKLILDPIVTDVSYLSYSLPEQVLYYAFYVRRNFRTWHQNKIEDAVIILKKFLLLFQSNWIQKNNCHTYRRWILESVLYAISDEELKAIDAMDTASVFAKQASHHLLAALCEEEASSMARESGKYQLQLFYLQRSIELYELCGLHEKANKLLDFFGNHTESSNAILTISSVSTYTDLSREVDIEVYLDVTRSISEEIKLSKLLEKLLKNVVLYANAQRGVILLTIDTDDLYVMLDGTSIQTDIVLHDQNIAYEDYESLPKSIIKFVFRTKESVVLKNAIQDNRFSSDPYLDREHVQSVMCIPIVKLGITIGIIYLEHRTIPQLFSTKEVRFASMIGSQAAVSIENSRLYELLETRILERTQELEISNQRLLDINEKLMQSESLRRQMISDISHDLRTPLTSIQGYIEAVLENVVSGEEVRNYLSIVRDRSLQMNHLIQDLLDLSKFDEHQGNMNKEMVSLIDLTNSLMRRYRFDIEHAGLNLETYTDPLLRSIEFIDWDLDFTDQELFVSVDIRRIDQVFSNLVHNAIRHTLSGGVIWIGVHLTNDLRILTENPGLSAKYVRIDIKDNGSGISNEDLPYIFERFYRADRARQKDTGGSGLGLAISKAIVDGHEGDIFAESKLGVGSTFSVVLPIAASVFEQSDGYLLSEIDNFKKTDS